MKIPFKIPLKLPKIRFHSLRIKREAAQELAILAGFLMVARGLYMVYPPAMWIICGLWLMFPAKRVR